MSNEIQMFNSPEFGEVRTILIDNEPWFVGKDVATALGYARPDNAITDKIDEDDRLYADEKLVLKTRMSFDYKSLGQRGGWLINESGLYSLIFSSKLETAKNFKKWVTSEVLPQIRKTGSYGMPMTTEEKIQILAQGNIEIKEEIQNVKNDLETLKMDLPVLPVEADRITNAVRRKGTFLLGGKDSNAYSNRSIRQKVYMRIYSILKYNFNVNSYKNIKRCQVETALEIIKEYKPPYFLKSLIDSECTAKIFVKE